MTPEQLKEMIQGIVKEVVGVETKDILAQRRYIDEILFSRGSEQKQEKLEKGVMAARIIRSLAVGKGDYGRAAAFAKKTWGEDSAIFKTMNVADSEAGGYFVPEEFSAEVIELLRERTVVRRLGPNFLPMETGTLSMPKVTGGATAYYQGEGDNITPSALATGQLKLTWRKLVCLVPISNDLLRYSAPSADTIVRDDMIAAMAEREDAAFIRDDGTGDKVKGLYYWADADNIFDANGTVNIANVTIDLAAAMLRLRQAHCRFLRPAWIFSPRTEYYLKFLRDSNDNYAFKDEMTQGKLLGYPYGSTTQIPENLGDGEDESEIYFADFADLIIGESMRLEVDVSSEAAYYDGANVVSAFSKDETVMRCISEHDFGCRHPESIAVIEAVTYGAA